jgi:hypothetical protein
MKKKIIAITGVAAAGIVAAALLSTVAPASAANGAKCGNGTLSVIRKNGSQQCYANRGDLGVNIQDVDYVDTGSNEGYFNWSDFSSGHASDHSTHFTRNERKRLGGDRPRITKISIK